MKRGLIALFLVTSLFLVACQDQGQSAQEQDVEWRTGSEGLRLQFLEGSPPRQIYEGDPLQLTVEFTNRGAHDITQGRMYISGYDRSLITLTPDRYDFTAEGKSRFNPLGQISGTANFEDTRVTLPDTAEGSVDSLRQTFKATACYKYRTIANAQVCIDPDPFGVAPEEKVCQVSDVSMGTQGAPVAVTSAQQEISRDRVQFKVQVSNVGGGTVIAPDASINECHTRLERNEIDRVRINAEFSDRVLDCEPELIRLTGGSGFAFCSYEGFLGDEAYETVLQVELDYGYRNSIQRDVEVRRLP